ncbi:MAG: rbfA [Panacagrimonas sp.]|jgi:ribosome-binding factor A|nr:30S ribosome-binding factor RbfA [Panacagrimonas sp.]MCC2657242.1 rbfA [Panacagrimonas sp.]
MKEYPRKLRINTQLQREVAALVVETLTDPRVAGVSITQVDVSPDLRNATVLVSSLGTDEELAASVKALAGAVPLLRKGLGSRLRMRYVPQLHFRADTQVRQADRLNRLIRDAVAADESHTRERDDS